MYKIRRFSFFGIPDKEKLRQKQEENERISPVGTKMTGLGALSMGGGYLLKDMGGNKAWAQNLGKAGMWAGGALALGGIAKSIYDKNKQQNQ